MTDLIERLYESRFHMLEAADALEAKDREIAALREQYEQLQARCFDSGGSQSVFDRCAELERDNVALAEFALRLLR